MAIFYHPVDPEQSYVWGKNGATDIRAIQVQLFEPNTSIAFMEAISKAKGVYLAKAGFRLPLADLEGFCRAFLAQRQRETGARDPVPDLLAACELASQELEAWSHSQDFRDVHGDPDEDYSKALRAIHAAIACATAPAPKEPPEQPS